jgi:hypothetical protein
VAIRAHPDRTTLLICSPPDKQDVAAKALVQPILKTVTIDREGAIELTFR